jgi:predicted nuclease with RNAse H fold
MRYCGIAFGPGLVQLCTLEEVLVEEPPVRLGAAFYEPGEADDVIAEIRSLGVVVVAVGAPAGEDRACDRELAGRGIAPLPFSDMGARVHAGLSDLGQYAPSTSAGRVEDGAFRSAALFETNPDGVFCALQGRRVPAKRHPFGIQLRIHELEQDQVLDAGASLWHRRIEEIEAAGAALAAHRYAVGHACWIGDPDEGVIVLPGSRLPVRFSSEGVLPSMPRQRWASRPTAEPSPGQPVNRPAQASRAARRPAPEGSIPAGRALSDQSSRTSRRQTS